VFRGGHRTKRGGGGGGGGRRSHLLGEKYC
jgi:hypothetical protein